MALKRHNGYPESARSRQKDLSITLPTQLIGNVFIFFGKGELDSAAISYRDRFNTGPTIREWAKERLMPGSGAGKIRKGNTQSRKDDALRTLTFSVFSECFFRGEKVLKVEQLLHSLN